MVEWIKNKMSQYAHKKLTKALKIHMAESEEIDKDIFKKR